MEIDQKTMRERAARLRKKLERLGAHRERTRRRRKRNGAPTVALVGYTNAGKSSLLDALCPGSRRAEHATSPTSSREILDADDEDNVYAIDAKPFATLDPLTRRAGPHHHHHHHHHYNTRGLPSDVNDSSSSSL